MYILAHIVYDPICFAYLFQTVLLVLFLTRRISPKMENKISQSTFSTVTTRKTTTLDSYHTGCRLSI
jgi:hypothetical protein